MILAIKGFGKTWTPSKRFNRRNISTESQAERMETAVTEFQRRFHISHDNDETNASPQHRHQVCGLGRNMGYVGYKQIFGKEIFSCLYTNLYVLMRFCDKLWYKVTRKILIL